MIFNRLGLSSGLLKTIFYKYIIEAILSAFKFETIFLLIRPKNLHLSILGMLTSYLIYCYGILTD